ncbi:AMP-binding protein [Bacillus cereus]|uniref:AMP-dependent synthetase/ligase domain-containing protein n=1 Tax=Bacillus cereus TaxID=1396 RepID=A0A9X6UIC6_BACCE|nr:AMP-binding protein [Bacillus cereus]PEQ83427.1 hypothetical protein CN475_23115 [Bacillus cereus]
MINNKFKSIIDIMESYIETNEIQTGQNFWNAKTQKFDYISYTDLSSMAFSIGNELINRGIKQRNICMIVCSSPRHQVLYFYACLAINVIPIIIPSSKALSGDDDLIKRISYWANNKFSDETFVLIENQNMYEAIDSLDKHLKVIHLPNLECLKKIRVRPINYKSSPNDIAYLQMTSASTGQGKAVVISHRNIVANVKGIHDGLNSRESEIVCSWLPLNHDMGLVGAELFSFYYGFQLFLMSPYEFLRKPIRWLETISDNKCTLSPCPNFGFEYTQRFVNLDKVVNLNLSSWKAGINGAEPIRSETLSNFYKKFQKFDLKPTTNLPVYGLAESTLASTFSSVEQMPNYVIIDKKSIIFGSKTIIKAEGVFDPLNPPNYNSNNEILSFSVGNAVLGLQVNIVDESYQVKYKELICGEIFIEGDSVALGYLTADDTEIQKFNGKFNTGDLGFIYKGNIYVLERLKNLIIRNGRNYLSSDLENYLSKITGLPETNIAVFEEDVFNPESDIIALIEIKRTTNIDSILKLIHKNKNIDLPISKIIFSQKTKIPKTTSGKKRHFLCRELLNNQAIEISQKVCL